MHWRLTEGSRPYESNVAESMQYLAGSLLQEKVAADSGWEAAGWGLGKAAGEEGLRLAAVGMAAGAGEVPWGSEEEGCTLAKGAGLPAQGWAQGCRLEWV